MRKKGKKRNGDYYCNHYYASQLEIKMAKILNREKIEFIPHAKFVVNDNGKQREVDFMFKQLIKPYWSVSFIQAIEVKGWLSRRDWDRRKELENVGIFCFMATPSVIQYWDENGFIENEIYKI